VVTVVIATVVAVVAPVARAAAPAAKAKRTAPGTVVSAVPIDGAPAGSKGWRIVYRTTTAAGAPAVSAGTVYVPTAPAPGGGKSTRFVVAWAHPTLGTGADCTPSQAADPAAAIPGFAEMMANGWVVTSTDYTGLGSPGVLPYLIGDGEAHNVLDSVRAAMNLPGTDAGTTFAVWGHSQGGHASLFTPGVADRYAPELRLVGVAGAAPAAELVPLVALQWNQFVAWVIGSEVIELWPKFYPALTAAQVATPVAQQNAARLGSICITADQSAVLAAFGSYLLQPFFQVDPTTVPRWRAKLAANTPTFVRAVPTFVAQGLQDDVVLPATTARLERDWCDRGGKVTVVWYPEATHFSIPTVSADRTVTWLTERFAGKRAGDTCAGTPPVTPATVAAPAR